MSTRGTGLVRRSLFQTVETRNLFGPEDMLNEQGDLGPEEMLNEQGDAGCMSYKIIYNAMNRLLCITLI